MRISSSANHLWGQEWDLGGSAPGPVRGWRRRHPWVLSVHLGKGGSLQETISQNTNRGKLPSLWPRIAGHRVKFKMAGVQQSRISATRALPGGLLRSSRSPGLRDTLPHLAFLALEIGKPPMGAGCWVPNTLSAALSHLCKCPSERPPHLSCVSSLGLL